MKTTLVYLFLDLLLLISFRLLSRDSLLFFKLCSKASICAISEWHSRQKHARFRPMSSIRAVSRQKWVVTISPRLRPLMAEISVTVLELDLALWPHRTHSDVGAIVSRNQTPKKGWHVSLELKASLSTPSLMVPQFFIKGNFSNTPIFQKIINAIVPWQIKL